MDHVQFSAARAVPMLMWLALLGAAAPASARLGGDFASVDADSSGVRGQLISTPMLAYERHDISSGTSVIREYLANGKVFAVSWQAPVPPDLQQLFGDYFESFRASAAAQAHPGAHRLVRVALPDLVVVSAGHLRAFRGKAYIPSLVPAGVNIADLP